MVTFDDWWLTLVNHQKYGDIIGDGWLMICSDAVIHCCTFQDIIQYIEDYHSMNWKILLSNQYKRTTKPTILEYHGDIQWVQSRLFMEYIHKSSYITASSMDGC